MSELPPTNEEDRHEEQLRPRIYVTKTGDELRFDRPGEWIDAAQPLEEVRAGIDRILADSEEEVPEDGWAIADYEDFGTLFLDESMDLTQVVELAQGVAKHGQAFAVWAEHLGKDHWHRLDEFTDRYRGHWDSLEEFAWDFATNVLDVQLPPYEDRPALLAFDLVANLRRLGIDTTALSRTTFDQYLYFDLDEFADHLSMDVEVVEDDGIYVFDR